jgi:hypothetical protein
MFHFGTYHCRWDDWGQNPNQQNQVLQLGCDHFGWLPGELGIDKPLRNIKKFNKQQRIESDFDREMKKLLQNRDTEE